MDILIKGMEMLKGCEGCFACHECSYESYDYCNILKAMTTRVERRKDCPLVALPEHGDLVDRKALSDAVGKVITDRDRMIGTYDTIEQIIDEAETIVEATE